MNQATSTLSTGERGGFYRRLANRHQRIAAQLGLLDRLFIWLRSQGRAQNDWCTSAEVAFRFRR
jgi:hypothetical protein